MKSILIQKLLPGEKIRRGRIYQHVDGTFYLCVGECDPKMADAAVMANIASGWTFHAYKLRGHENGKITWKDEIGGRFYGMYQYGLVTRNGRLLAER